MPRDQRIIESGLGATQKKNEKEAVAPAPAAKKEKTAKKAAKGTGKKPRKDPVKGVRRFKRMVRRMRECAAQSKPFFREGSIKKIVESLCKDLGVEQLRFRNGSRLILAHLVQKNVGDLLEKLSSGMFLGNVKTLKPKHVKAAVPDL